MFGLFSYLRGKVRDAILAGVREALHVVETAPAPRGVLLLEPRPEAEAPPVAADQGDDAGPARANGRRTRTAV